MLLTLGCTVPAPTPGLPTLAATLPPRSTWGAIVTLAQTPQSHAPSLTFIQGKAAVVWIGADAAGVHHDMRFVRGEQPDPAFVLPLPPVRPRDQTLLTAGEEGLHLLWLDARYNAPAAALAQTQLQYANLDPEGVVTLGPFPLSDELALRYDAAINPDGSMWAVWSGDLPAEPILYARYLDRLGRPQPIQRVAFDGDYPVFARAADGTLYLFWRAASTGAFFCAIFDQGVLRETQQIAPPLRLEPGDALIQMQTGLDTTHGYLLLTVLRADGTPETWFSSGEIGAGTWSAPTLWLTDDGRRFRWSALLTPALQRDLLPAIAQVDDELWVVYWRGGQVARQERILIVGRLIGSPALYSAVDGRLVATWAQPDAAGFAALNIAIQPP